MWKFSLDFARGFSIPGRLRFFLLALDPDEHETVASAAMTGR
jgi:hypothetical protein